MVVDMGGGAFGGSGPLMYASISPWQVERMFLAPINVAAVALDATVLDPAGADCSW